MSSGKKTKCRPLCVCYYLGKTKGADRGMYGVSMEGCTRNW